jgi:hypothetical protein
VDPEVAGSKPVTHPIPVRNATSLQKKGRNKMGDQLQTSEYAEMQQHQGGDLEK